MRIWDLKGSNFSNPVILYDHEEEIISASVYQNLIASMDVEGTIIVRDMRNYEVISSIRLNRQYETGQVLFNQNMKNELIVFYNNDLEVYDTDGRLIQNKELDFNVTHAVQDEDSVIFSYENGCLAVYDWNKDKLVEEKEDFGVVKSMSVSSQSTNRSGILSKNDKMLVTGGERGEVTILRRK